MDEEDWLADRHDVSHLVEYCPGSPRKERLFCIACCRRVLEYLPGEGSRRAVDAAERYADGLATIEELTAAHGLAEPYESVDYGYRSNPAEVASGQTLSADTCALAASLLRADKTVSGASSTWHDDWEEIDNAESLEQVRLYREIFGNPFRPVVVDPEWRTPTVMQFARGIYDNRDYTTMPILADALQDAGCSADELLKHLRDPNATHVRGCWALDLVLGKS